MAALRRIVVLLNAGAGAFDGQDAARIQQDLAERLQARGIEAELRVLRGDELEEAATVALERGKRGEIDAVLAGGGDGTIRSVARVLAGTEIPLGVLPLGTFNHFAKELGLPLDLAAAIDVAAAGHVRAVDAGEVNGKIFLNNSSIGIYPFLVLNRERRRRRQRRTKWLATCLAARDMLRHFPLHRLTILAEGSTTPVRTTCLFVGNNRYELVPAALARRERLDSGELWIYVARQQSRLALLWLAFRLWFGLVDPTRHLQIMKSKAAEISRRKGHLLVATDGEIEMMSSPLHYRSRPGALRVIVPDGGS
jgi:diacylglycerol kinase family enzyme